MEVSLRRGRSQVGRPRAQLGAVGGGEPECLCPQSRRDDLVCGRGRLAGISRLSRLGISVEKSERGRCDTARTYTERSSLTLTQSGPAGWCRAALTTSDQNPPGRGPRRANPACGWVIVALPLCPTCLTRACPGGRVGEDRIARSTRLDDGGFDRPSLSSLRCYASGCVLVRLCACVRACVRVEDKSCRWTWIGGGPAPSADFETTRGWARGPSLARHERWHVTLPGPAMQACATLVSIRGRLVRQYAVPAASVPSTPNGGGAGRPGDQSAPAGSLSWNVPSSTPCTP